MAVRERSFGNTLKNLLLAMLNATLILVVLCLALWYGAASAFERAMDGLGEQVASIRPVSGELKTLNEELKALRGDLASIREQGRESREDALEKAAAKLDAVERKLASFGEKVEELAEKPDRIVDAALDRIAGRVGAGLSALAPCIERRGEKPGEAGRTVNPAGG